MAIPFAGLFKKARDRMGNRVAKNSASAVAEPPREKPSSERLSKTVMPNATRTLAPSDPFEIAVHSNGNGAVVAAPSAHRVVAVGRTQQSMQSRDLPPAVALALTPQVERTISLALIDIIPHMPKDLMKPSASFDADKRILLKAAEVEKGMAVGAPKVSLSFIHQQVPDMFMRKIESNDPTQVELPIDKVLEQFSNARLRRDQVTDAIIPQVETPFLQVTIEDTRKFGGTMDPIMASSLPMPSVLMEPATARSLADAEPEPTVSEKFTPTPASPPNTTIKPATKIPSAPPYGDALPARKPIKLDLSEPTTEEKVAEKVIPEPTATKSAAPLRIPIAFPPNGAGELANKRVPASAEPPVPTSAAATTIAQPTRIPFKLAMDDAPSVAVAEKPAEPARDKSAKPATDEPCVTLALRPILEALPPMQLNGDPAAVGDATISFACATVQPQLASGRIGIAPKQFLEAMPAEHRALFLAEALEVPVALPLAEVLKNLPASSLQLRDDQEAVVTGEEFQTPFALKAQEDAKRFAAEKAASEQPEAAIEKPAEVVAEKTEAKLEAAAAPVKLDAKLETAAAPEKLDAKQLVARATAMPGVASCSVTFTDGLSLAGNIPNDMGIEGISAMAPAMLQRMEKHMSNTKLGQLSAMTLHCTESPVTFVMCGNICLTAVHNGQELTAATRGKLAALTQEISETYSQPEKANVDH